MDDRQRLLARISHQLSAAATDLAVWPLRFGRAKVLPGSTYRSGTPRPLGPPLARPDGHLRRLATKPGEKCGLADLEVYRLLGKLWSGALALLVSVLVGSGCAKVPIDASFGSEGFALFDVTPGKNDDLRAMTVGSDNAITLAGGTNGDFVVLRLDSEGQPSATFGTKGIATVDFSGGADTAVALIPLSDGGLIVVGDSRGGSGTAPAVARLKKNGTLDTSFGAGGKVRLDFGFSMETRAAAVASNGRLVIAGRALGAGKKWGIALAALDRNGSLDRSFAGSGSLTNQLGPESDDLTGLQMGTDSSVIAVGHSSRLGLRDGLAVKYTSAGRLDGTFGAAGKRLLNVTAANPNLESTFSDDRLLGLASLPSQAFLAFGTTTASGTTQAVLARFKAGGSVDSSFGTEGISSFGVDAMDLTATAAALKSDGSLWVAGRIDLQSEHFYVLAQVSSTGVWDPDLGGNGLLRADFPAAEGAPALLVRLTDGRLLLGGTFQNTGHRDLGVLRLNP